MLDFYFESRVRLSQLRRGCLGKHLDGFAAELQRNSYARNTARRILSVAGQFSSFAGAAGVAAEDIDADVVGRFLDDALVGQGLLQDAPKAVRHLLGYLRRRGVVAQPAAQRAIHPFAATFDGFDRYMRDVRGLAASTRRGYLVNARAFVDWLRGRHGDRRALRALAGPDVLDFISQQLEPRKSRSARGHLCGRVRGFLRYLHASGWIKLDLTRAVPRISTPRLAALPPRLSWEEVRTLVEAVDASHPVGMRDKAILLLVATLGLRSFEVRALELGDIAWRRGEIHLPRTKTRRERVLPLLPEVGSALADYVLRGRPRLSVPQVFLRHVAPPGPLKNANTLTSIVRRALLRARISVRRGGTHMLRHSLATRMVNEGVPIKSVADVLGHASIDTTAIYTKVDTKTLSSVALPFPGGER